MEGTNYKTYNFSKKEIVYYIFSYSLFLFSTGLFFFRNIFFALLSLIFIPFVLKNKRQSLLNKRNKLIQNEFCDALQVISVSLSSGKSINRAFVESVCELELLYGNKNGIIVREFAGISKRLSLNQNLKDALKDLADRTNCDEIQSFTEAEELCRITGGNLIEVVKNTYQTIHQKNEIENDIDVICAEQKLNFKILLVIPFIITFIMTVFSPEYINVIFTADGRIFIIISFIMILFAYFTGSKILSGSSGGSFVNVEYKKRPANKYTEKFVSYLKKYTYERKLKALFIELYDSDGEYYYKRHRNTQIKLSFVFCVASIFLILFTESRIELMVLSLLCIAAVFVIKDRQIKDKISKKSKLLEDEFPLFLSKLAILTDAGVTIKSAIERISFKMPENLLKRQLMYLVRDFSYGKSDEICFEGFARRCKTKGAAAFSTLILQSIKKGGGELSAILRMYAKTSWDKKKADIKISGEEKAMKLMIPTMLIFIALMILMAAPAIVNMNLV